MGMMMVGQINECLSVVHGAIVGGALVGLPYLKFRGQSPLRSEVNADGRQNDALRPSAVSASLRLPRVA